MEYRDPAPSAYCHIRIIHMARTQEATNDNGSSNMFCQRLWTRFSAPLCWCASNCKHARLDTAMFESCRSSLAIVQASRPKHVHIKTEQLKDRSHSGYTPRPCNSLAGRISADCSLVISSLHILHGTARQQCRQRTVLILWLSGILPED